MYNTKNENNKEIYKKKEKGTKDKKLFIENILIVITIVKFIKIKINKKYIKKLIKFLCINYYKIYENKTYSK